MESSEIKLPKKGIVIGVELDNLYEFFNRTQHSIGNMGKFEILAELEKKVKGEKIRHLTEYVPIVYKQPSVSIVFRISRYIKGENQEEYIVYYKFEGFIS
jgi:hypothetical protein